ncbi:MAG: dihydroorotate dehydrogenase-like protein [Candidatus Delongbacteria bacterium]|jgi:dihydroorotate dehydrogenase (fumarate)|nr:dihydroorotate dehydrogenase-like protein [Candidatus Delongbacteria bacterium]
MATLNTSYMGIPLKSPVVIGASNLVTKKETIKQLQENGAGAIVYKSLFEEQLHLESLEMSEITDEMDNRHAEMIDMFPKIEHAGTREHVMKFKEIREILDIPLIASINAVYKESWPVFAKDMEDAGANGLELNFYAIPRDFSKSSTEIEEEQVKVVREVKRIVNIPVSVKLSPQYSNILNVIKRMDEAGADAFVLFNRLFEPEIDPDKEKHVVNFDLSKPWEHRQSLRFAGLLYDNIEADIVSSGGIFTAEDIASMVLAGADSVQMVSAVYKHQPKHIEKVLEKLNDWMEKHGYNSLDDFKGKLSSKNVTDNRIYKRAQYVDLLMKAEHVFKKYPMP